MKDLEVIPSSEDPSNASPGGPSLVPPGGASEGKARLETCQKIIRQSGVRWETS